jgi:hypothetical protein
VRSDSIVAQLHQALQVAFGWEDEHLMARQRVTFLSDGGDTVRELPAFLRPHSEHILDWFHIGMRVEELSQTARGSPFECLMTKEKVIKELERVRWMWHNQEGQRIIMRLCYADAKNPQNSGRLHRDFCEP